MKDKRFVIQKHSTGLDIHWDLMLETNDTLQTYRLDKAPEEILHSGGHAVKIFDHPLKFLTYQGPVNKGRGNVCIAEIGIYQKIEEKEGLIKLSLIGHVLKGNLVLTHVSGDKWLLKFESPPPV